jgi:predicted outer membrane repeat protein
LVVVLILVASADAATLTVNSSADAGGTCPGVDCTLRQALATAVSGDTINFAAALSTITLTSGELVINKAVTISGPGANLLTVRRDPAAANFRIFETFFVALFTNITISGITIANGSADIGGAIYSSRELLSITNCVLSGNTATNGGAIYTDPNAGVTTTNTTLSGNTAALGGAIYNVTNGGVTLINSTLSGNSATASSNGGGALYNLGSATITGTTISGNSATRSGGAIFNNGTITITSSTISGNSATGASAGGGGIYNLKTVNVSSTIIARNTSHDFGPDLDGTFVSQSYNFIGDSTNSTGFTNGTNSDQVGTAPAIIDPKLDVLKDNGGPTFTQALLSGSAAINKGNSGGLTTDQRGFARPVYVQGTAFPAGGDGSDIGAYEVQADQLSGCSTISRVVTTKLDNVAGSLRTVIANVCVGSTITFAADIRGAILLTAGQLLIDKNLIISGPGANLLAVQRDASVATARIFNIAASRNVVISGLTISNGTAPADRGGGILNGGTLTLINDTVSLNSAIGGNGGGIYNNFGTLAIVGSTISGNKIDSATAGSGGGIFNFGGTITISNSTLSGNSAVSPGNTSGDHGGAIFSNQGSVTITSSTISTNKSDIGGGLLAANAVNIIKAKSTIIALNTAPSGPDVSGPLTSQGFNIFGSTSGATISPPAAPAVDQVGAVQLNLGGLQDNGGPTFTHALMPGSTAIDQGISGGSATDQRGHARAIDFSNSSNPAGGDGTDVGAFEYAGIPPSVTTGAATDITTTTATLNATVNPNGLDSFLNFVLEFDSFSPQFAGSGVAAVPVSMAVSGLAPGTQYHYHAVAINSAGTTAGVEQTFTTLPAPTPTPTPNPSPTPPNPTPTATPTATATPGLVANVSTRLPVGTGDNVLIEGFIVQGPVGSAKKIMVRAIGPSLFPFGIADALPNPTLEIHDSSNAIVATNDDWKNTQVGGLVTGDQSAEISASQLAPGNDLESAIIADLAPGSYTAVVRGLGDTVGTGVVDAYDLSGGSSARLANIATRGLVQPGDKLMIAGFIVQNGAVRAVIRAIGPSLTAFGINNALPDTTLQLRDQNGVIAVENDDWKVRSDGSSQQAELEATGLQPSDAREAAFVTVLQPGQYTAQVRGKPETTGIGVVQVYFLE